MAPTRNAVHIVWADFAQVLQQGKKLEGVHEPGRRYDARRARLVGKSAKAAREKDAQVAASG